MTPSAIRAAVEALEIGRDAVAADLAFRKDAYAGWPHKWASEQEDLEKVDAALSLLREAGERGEPQPVAVRYKSPSGRGRWHYLNYPFTKGWDFPPNLGTPEFLYASLGDVQVDARAEQQTSNVHRAAESRTARNGDEQ